MSSEPAIAARGLGKAYPIYRRPEDRLKQLLWGRRRRFYEEYWALKDVDLCVGRGETVGIIGPNGSGKSTLLQMICGTLSPSAGEVRVKGRVAAMLELGSGFNPEFTGRENARMGAAVLGLSREEIEQRFDAIAAFADIGAFMDQPIKRYSSGMHARLAFAVCANVDADVLIVDEVLSVGDAAFQQKCMRFLNRFRMHGTLLLVSHDSGAIVKLCDRALWLEQGRVRGFGPAKEMSRLYLAAQAEDAAESGDGFRIGGRRRLSQGEIAAPAPPAEQNTGEDTPIGAPDVLDFDADDISPPGGGARIVSAGFYDRAGTRLRVAAGGEPVELRILFRAERKLSRPVVAFAVRDRLGQIIFSDDTQWETRARSSVPDATSLEAGFSFYLPHLASGAYAVEAFVFDNGEDRFDLLDRRQDPGFLYVQSAHISNGLANIAMRAVSLEILATSAEPLSACDALEPAG